MAEQMTQAAYEKIHRDFKLDLGGFPHVLRCGPDEVTRLVPVAILAEPAGARSSRELERIDDDLHNLNGERFG